MKFKTDENMPYEVAEILSKAGHDALTVLCQELGGQSDDRIAEVCKAEGRAIVTLDLDYSDIRAYPPEISRGSLSCAHPPRRWQMSGDWSSRFWPFSILNPSRAISGLLTKVRCGFAGEPLTGVRPNHSNRSRIRLCPQEKNRIPRIRR